MKLLYVAGPYRADSIRGVQQNIERASDVAYKYWMKGYAVISPHKNTSFFDGPEFEDAQMWIEGDLVILEKCQVIVMMKGWNNSEGSKKEHKFAQEHNLEVIYE